MKCKRLCAWLLSLVMMFSLLPVSAAAVDSSATTPVYVFFQTINTNGKPVEVKKGVTYNVNGNSWATLGKLVTTTGVTTETPLGGEVFDGNSSFTRHSSNSGLDLKLIRGWDKPKQASGAPGYNEEEGKMTWHLDGTVYGYRAIYCDSDRKELTDFAPNKTPEYYLEGTAGIKVTEKNLLTRPVRSLTAGSQMM